MTPDNQQVTIRIYYCMPSAEAATHGAAGHRILGTVEEGEQLICRNDSSGAVILVRRGNRGLVIGIAWTRPRGPMLR
jgi:hypothetical protein